MPEYHTIDFVRGSVNIVSDAERGIITLQFDPACDGAEPIGLIWKAIETRFGGGIPSRLNRWCMGENNPLILPRGGKPHPENADVLCFPIGIEADVRMDAALATLIGFLQQLPGYRRTFGSPLHREHGSSPARKTTVTDVADAASETLMRIHREMKKKYPERDL
jgi:hypothetical protein